MSTKQSQGPKKKKHPRTGRAAAARRTTRQVVAQKIKRKVPALRRALAGGPEDPIVRRCMLAMVNPSAGPYRLCTEAQSTPTALVDLHIISNRTVTTSQYAGTYGSLIPAGSIPFAFFRDPLRSVVIFSPSVGAYSYGALFYVPGSVGAIGPNAVIQPGAQGLTPLYFTAGNGATPHGQYLFCGHKGSLSGYFWVDPAATVQIVRTGTSGSDTVQLNAYNGTEQDSVAVGCSMILGTGVATATLTPSSANYPRGGYFRVVYTNGSTSNNTATVTIITSGASDVFAHLSFPKVIDHLPQLSEARVNGISLLLSNVTAKMFQSGSVQAVNLDNDTQWNELLGLDTLNTETSNDRRFFYDQPWEKGIYTYLPPMGKNSLDFQDLVVMDTAASVAKSCSYELGRDRFDFGLISAGAGVATVGSSISFILNLTAVLEFSTNDPWYEVAMPQAYPQHTLTATAAVGRMDTFYENPSHLQKIANFLGSAWGSLRRHAGKIGAGLSAMFPQLASPIGAFASALQS